MQPITSSHSGLIEDIKPLHETLSGRVALTGAATLSIASCVYVSISLFFTPTPMALQTFFVILIGMGLGPVASFLANETIAITSKGGIFSSMQGWQRS